MLILWCFTVAIPVVSAVAFFDEDQHKNDPDADDGDHSLGLGVYTDVFQVEESQLA